MIQLLLRHSSLVIVIYCLFCGLCLNLDVLNSSLFGPSRISMTVCNRICSVIKGAGGLMPFRKIARLCIQQRFEFNCYLFSLTQSTFIMKGKNSIRVKLLLSLFNFLPQSHQQCCTVESHIKGVLLFMKCLLCVQLIRVYITLVYL